MTHTASDYFFIIVLSDEDATTPFHWIVVCADSNLKAGGRKPSHLDFYKKNLKKYILSYVKLIVSKNLSYILNC